MENQTESYVSLSLTKDLFDCQKEITRIKSIAELDYEISVNRKLFMSYTAWYFAILLASIIGPWLIFGGWSFLIGPVVGFINTLGIFLLIRTDYSIGVCNLLKINKELEKNEK